MTSASHSRASWPSLVFKRKNFPKHSQPVFAGDLLHIGRRRYPIECLQQIRIAARIAQDSASASEHIEPDSHVIGSDQLYDVVDLLGPFVSSGQQRHRFRVILERPEYLSPVGSRLRVEFFYVTPPIVAVRGVIQGGSGKDQLVERCADRSHLVRVCGHPCAVPLAHDGRGAMNSHQSALASKTVYYLIRQSTGPGNS